VNYTVNSTATNFSSAVTLTVSGLPAGATSGFVPNPITPPQSSALTITVASNTTPGTYPLTITGTSGSLTTNASATLVVTAASGGGSTLYEAELLPVTTNGAAINVVADTNASNGAWVSLLSTNSGPWMEYTLTNVAAGIYDLSLLYKQHPNRGIHTLTVDGVQLGGQLNQYSNVVAYPEKDFGNITFTTNGDHAVRLTAVGKDPAAGTPNISADAFRLTSTNEAWLSQDIGAVGLVGSFSQSNNTFTLAGSGADIWTTGDQFRYAYQNVSGDIDFQAKVVSETLTAPFAKAGLMIRASLATNSVNAAVLLTPTNGIALQCRPTTGAASINVTGWIKGPVPPYWVRLTRVGNTFTAYSSPDGSSWTQVGQTNVTMSPGVTAGMAVSAHDNTKLNTATFQ
jgi:regulation of enolase protein 1 (concanavalin A-like superfamily)